MRGRKEAFMWQEIEITNSRAKIILNSQTYQFSLSHFITRLHFICIVILKTFQIQNENLVRSRIGHHKKITNRSAMIRYLENKVGVVDFANAQGLVMF